MTVNVDDAVVDGGSLVNRKIVRMSASDTLMHLAGLSVREAAETQKMLLRSGRRGGSIKGLEGGAPQKRPCASGWSVTWRRTWLKPRANYIV